MIVFKTEGVILNDKEENMMYYLADIGGRTTIYSLTEINAGIQDANIKEIIDAVRGAKQ